MLRQVYDATWGRAFAMGYDRVLEASEQAGLRDLRRETLAEATGRTLEIGAGTGLNHDLYTEAVTELVLTEPFEPMARQLRAKVMVRCSPESHPCGARPIGDRPALLRQRSGCAPPQRGVEVVEAPAERLPFPDDGFDTVVVTLVLCTVEDPAQALREIARVLKPGGRLLFLEHVRAEEPRLARWQDRLHGPWYVLGHGCHCNRDTLATIGASPLEVERAVRGRIPKAAPLVRPLLRGSATLAPGESTTGGAA